MRDWPKRLYEWGLKWANTKWGILALFICAFADASVLPLPTPMFFLTLILLNTGKAYRYALSGTLGTLFGALLGYAIGHFAWLNANGGFTGFARFMFDILPGFSESGYHLIQVQYAKWDFWILFVAALVPVPYKIFSISSGVFDINLVVFCMATLVSQGIKFYLLALLIVKTGARVKKILEVNLKPVLFTALAIIVISIIAFRIFL
jgi:membrane protein YqaA with SNARE-associated domain